MGEIHKGIDCLKSVVGHLSPDWKGRDSKQRTVAVGETALIQTNLLWAYPLADLLKYFWANSSFWWVPVVSRLPTFLHFQVVWISFKPTSSESSWDNPSYSTAFQMSDNRPITDRFQPWIFSRTLCLCINRDHSASFYLEGYLSPNHLVFSQNWYFLGLNF